MYGTIAHFHLKPGASFDALVRQLREDTSYIPGIVGSYIYRTDANSDECFVAIVFESKEKYWANAKSAEQDARYRKMLAFFEGEPEWHDGAITWIGKEKSPLRM